MTGTEPKPLVSVVVASYNRANLLMEALESVFRQGVADLEVVVSDDASQDGSGAMLAGLGDPRVRVHLQPKNVGAWLNWTTALRMARGEFVVFLGDDDWLGEGFLARHLEVFQRHPQLSAVFCELEDRPADGGESQFYRPGFPVGEPVPGRAVVEGLLATQLFFGAAMFRREAAVEQWEETKPDDMVADWGLLLGLGVKPGVLVSACSGCRYVKRIHPARLSSRYLVLTRLLAEVCERIARKCPDADLRRRLEWRAMMERVTLSRHHAAEGDLASCRSVLWSCVRQAGWHGVVVKQLVQAYLTPGRLVRSARLQRGKKE